MKVKAPFRMVAYMGGYLVKPATGFRILQRITPRQLNRTAARDLRERLKGEN